MNIIFIISFSPKYENLTERSAKPIHSWQNPKGELIGVWIQDFAHYFGFNLLKFYPFLHFEVWRPDFRAEKIYEHTFENGLVHRSFPVARKSYQQGLSRKKGEYAPLMEMFLDDIASRGNKHSVVLVPATGSVSSIRLFRKYHKLLPMIGYHFLANISLFRHMPSTVNPFKYIHYKLIEYQHKKHMGSVRNLSLSHWE